MQITRQVCTRNCYDTCSFLAYVEDGRLVKVSGNPWQTYTVGTLCCKGYNYVKYVYHPDRILHPLRQTPRGSGNWERITWDEALGDISKHILDIYKESGSFLPVAYQGGTGNTGVLAQSMLHMFSSLGPITRIESYHAGAVGQDAQILDFGRCILKDPEEMKDADLIILWGVNPASTAIHQMRILQRARRQGSKVILIDVFPSRTANWVDESMLVHPGGDGALALAVLRDLIYKNSIDYHFVTQESEGWEDFQDWLLKTDPQKLAGISGVSSVEIAALADKIRCSSSVAFWLGKGLQRYGNSGQNIRGIHALAAAGGLMGDNGGGVYAPIELKSLFTGMWEDRGERDNRKVSHYSFSECGDTFPLNPVLRMLWITQCNPLAQGTDFHGLRKTLNKIDLIVTTDHFLTETAKNSDIFLPATTLFETEDIVVGSWNKWLGLNEQAIAPLGEAKSELEIAQDLTRVLNQNLPGICSFPADRSRKEWLDLSIVSSISEILKINGSEDLKSGPRKISVSSLMSNQKGKYKYRFTAPEAVEQGCPEIPSLVAPMSPPIGYPFRLISIHKVDAFNSQLGNMSWLVEGQERADIFLGEQLARMKEINSGDRVTVYNRYGEVALKAKVCRGFPDPILIIAARVDVNGKSINTLISAQQTDLGKISRNFSDIAYHDTYVNIVRG